MGSPLVATAHVAALLGGAARMAKASGSGSRFRLDPSAQLTEDIYMTRYEKFEYLQEICSEQFMKENFVLELINWMSEDDFDKFYNHLCRMHDIPKDYDELNELINA